MEEIIDLILKQFDFVYCIIVNILTYIIIKLVDAATIKPISIWTKRLILLVVLSSTGVLYHLTGSNTRILINSAILAPVFWSWIMKPVCKKLNIDYKQIDSVIEN